MKWLLIAIALFVPAAAAHAAPKCPPPTADLVAMPKLVETSTRRLDLGPLACFSAPQGIRCGTKGMAVSVAVTGSHLVAGNPAIIAACSPDDPRAECFFIVGFTPTRVEAGRRGDAGGWRLIEMKAEGIDLRPAQCR